jgi:AcrR family transcriptional regulator
MATTRPYRMRRRAEGVEATTARILRATFALHAEQGVAATTQADVAARAGLAPATVYRHFPTQGALVRFCGAHTWEAIAPPTPEAAPRVFEGVATAPARLRRLAEEVAAFYARGALPLQGAREDRSRVPELDAFLRRVEAGLEALARAALAPDRPSEERVRLALALTDFGVWQALRAHGVAADTVPRLLADLLRCALDGPHAAGRPDA